MHYSHIKPSMMFFYRTVTFIYELRFYQLMAVKIDLKDRRILYELDLNSRQSNKQIAKRVGLSEQVTGNRIKRLMDLGVIEYFYAKTNLLLLGYVNLKIYLRLHNITEQKEKEMIEELNKQKGILWLASLRGKYDLVISLNVKNIADFSDRYEELLGKWGEYILDKDVILLEKGHIYTKSYLLNKESEEIIYTKGDEPAKLDETNIKLLRILNNRAREQLIEIAKEVGISADNVRYRMKNLEAQGVLAGYGAKIDYRKLSNTYSLIFLKLQNMTKEKQKRLETLAKANKNIIYLIRTIGDHDIELETETSDKRELDLLVRSLKDAFPAEIKDYEILEVTEEHRLTYYPF